jgi:hypothetical protein
MHSDNLKRSHLIGTYDTGAPDAHLEQYPGPSKDEMRKRLAEYGHMRASRDVLVTGAKTAGLSEVEIAELTGHSRNTIRSILKRKKGD